LADLGGELLDELGSAEFLPPRGGGSGATTTGGEPNMLPMLSELPVNSESL
jgi:hypothetical protein